MPVYKTTFDVNASADAVWRVLTNLDEYGEWNPQIPTARGAVQEKGKITLRLALPGRPVMDLVATFEDVRRNELLTWRGHIVAPWFFEGYRKFEIRAAGDHRVSVTHVEDIHGLFAPLFAVFMGTPIKTSQHAFNHALRTRAETSQ